MKKYNNFKRLYLNSIDDRLNILDMIYIAKSGHIGSSFSCVELLNCIYDYLEITNQNVDKLYRNKFILSKGHAAPALYATLINRNILPKSSIKYLRKFNSILQGHPDMKKTRGVDMTSGSLGNGLSVGAGMAWTQKKSNQDLKTIVLLGDGELQEGIIYEAAMTAAHLKLGNLIAIIDNNKLQINGSISDIMPIHDIYSTWRGLGWNILTIDGHNIEETITTLNNIDTRGPLPTLVIAKTIKGKGVLFMENDPIWHSKIPNELQYKLAKYEIERKKYEQVYTYSSRGKD